MDVCSKPHKVLPNNLLPNKLKTAEVALQSCSPAVVMPTGSHSACCTLIQTDGASVGVPLLHLGDPLRSIPRHSCYALALEICLNLQLLVVHVLHCAPLAAKSLMTGAD